MDGSIGQPSCDGLLVIINSYLPYLLLVLTYFLEKHTTTNRKQLPLAFIEYLSCRRLYRTSERFGIVPNASFCFTVSYHISVFPIAGS